MILIEKIKIKDLYGFASDIAGNTDYAEVLPITRKRAQAHMHNPHADKDDIGLLVAYEGTRCVGYLGIMPGLKKTGSEYSKVYWFSTFFVHPGSRKMGIGSKLVEQAFALNYDYAATSMARLSERVFRRAGMQELEPLSYGVLDLNRFNFLSRCLSLAKRGLRKFLGIDLQSFAWLVRLSDKIYLGFFTRLFYGVLLKPCWRNTAEKLRCEKVDKISAGEYLEPPADNEKVIFYRGMDSINWMLSDIWVINKEDAQPDDRRYFFSVICDDFKFHGLKIYAKDAQKHNALLVFSIAKNAGQSILKVLDIVGTIDMDWCAYLIMRYAYDNRVTRLEFPESLFSCIRRMIFAGGLLLKLKKRLYLYWPVPNGKSPGCLKQVALSYSDGDSAFF